MAIVSPCATILGLQGGAERPIYIGGDKEVDFVFRIMYKLSSESTAERASAATFFDGMAAFIENGVIPLGDNRAQVKCVMTSTPYKAATNGDNSQVWQADFTLTYRESK